MSTARHNPFSRKLYLRIWLAVGGSVLALSLFIGWAWHLWEQAREQERERERQSTATRHIVVRDPLGNVIAQGEGLLLRRPGQPPAVIFKLPNGQELHLQTSPIRGSRRGGPPDTGPLGWLRPPYGFVWLLSLAALVVMIGVLPVVRRLTQRLEGLQLGVQRWGTGDLSTRLPESGADEVADLSRHFNAAAQRVERLMQSQKSLLANASHELRSPLARIRMALELGGSQLPPHTRAEITQNISELDQLVEEILLASRLDASEADLGTIEPVDMIGLVAEEAARVGAEFELAPSAQGHELLIQGIAKLLRRAVRNLLENASRHGQRAGRNGQVSALLAREGQHLLLHVLDRGPGIPPDQRERIFEPFYRLPGASEREGGVGLGLALVKSIAQRHHGSVQAGNREGGGACFTLSLPLP